jgi:hypothetical protein
MYLIYALRGRPIHFLASFALGVLFWSFSDVLGDSAYLGVNEGFSGGVEHASLIALFLMGFFLLVMVDRSGLNGKSSGGKVAGALALVPFIVALGWAFHSFGEGLDLGGLAATTTSVSLIDALGGVSPGISYMLHKFLEASTIGAAYLAYSSNATKPNDLTRIGSLGLIFGGPTILGAALGYYIPIESTYSFALGAGAAVYIFFKLVQPILASNDGSRGYFVSCMLLTALGFFCLYFAALFHS